MGSPDFAAKALQALHDSDHEIICVYTQPPRPKGRGQQLEKTAVHHLAELLGYEVRTPPTFKDPQAVADFQALNADIAVVAAYGLILRQVILNAPRRGCINIHGSILPRWRGAAPVQRAIEAGDSMTGITTMQMDIGLDTGDMLLIKTTPISAQDTSQTLMDRLSDIGAELILETLDRLDTLTPQKQDESDVTYAHKMTKQESIIDWSHKALDIERRLRAFTPWPGLWMKYKNQRLRVHKAHVQALDHSTKCGQIIANPLVVACGDGALAITEIQKEGKNAQSIESFCQAFPVIIGDLLSDA